MGSPLYEWPSSVEVPECPRSSVTWGVKRPSRVPRGIVVTENKNWVASLADYGTNPIVRCEISPGLLWDWSLPPLVPVPRCPGNHHSNRYHLFIFGAPPLPPRKEELVDFVGVGLLL